MNEIADEYGEHRGVTFSLVRLRTSRTDGIVVVGPNSRDFVELEVHTAAAARDLRDLFEKLANRLGAAERAVNRAGEDG